MKKLQLITFALLFSIFAASCHRGRHIIIRTQSNDVSIKIDYTGDIALNNEQNEIVGISHDGYINYDNNGSELHITSDHGRINYELNGNKTNVLDTTGKRLLAEAIKIIVKQQMNH